MSKVAKEGFIPNLPSKHRHSISKMKTAVMEGVNLDPQDKTHTLQVFNEERGHANSSVKTQPGRD